MRLFPRTKYVSLALASIQRATAYRGTTLLNLVANLVWVAVMYYLWRTVFAQNTRVERFDWGEMRTYILVSYAVNALLSFGSVFRMTNTIRTGEIATELARPIDYLGNQLAQAFGAALVEGGLSGAIAFLLGLFLVGIAAPDSPSAAALFLLSVTLGFLIKFLLGYLTALLCFWTTNSIGLIWAQTAVINLFSGALIPLPFFPDWLKTIVLATPFPGIVYTPVAIYLGRIQGLELLGALGIQILWIGGLWLLARLLWGPSVRALDIQGG
jgi:ABC-2 type transport system permease protein